MNKLKIEYLDINKIKPYNNNPRKNEESVKVVKKSIKEFGFKNPIILDKNNEIIAGHTRLKAAKELELKKVPVIWAKDLSPAQVKAFRIMDNKSQEYSEWDMKLLKKELDEIDNEGFDLDLTGFDLEEIGELCGGGPKEDDFDTEKSLKEPKYKIKRGDLFELGNHRLICGDAKNKEDIERLIEDNEINLIFTSPPYNMGRGMYKNYADNLASEEYINLNIECLKLLKKYLRGFIFWNLSYNKKTRWEFMEIFNRIRKELGFTFLELICWNKKSAIPITSKKLLTRQYEDIALFGTEEEVKEQLELYWVGTTEKIAYFNKKKGKGITNYWELKVNGVQLDDHKACFPVRLAGKGISLMSDKNDIVVDPFGGSGSTLVACEQLNRRCFVVELDPTYCSVIIERWEKYTGNQHKKIQQNSTKNEENK
jgi:site-specific DNA-methyltransferase (adenine-specific)